MVRTTDIGVGVVDEGVEGGQQLADGVDVRRRVLVAAQVDDDPGDVAQETDGYRVGDKVQQDRHDAQTDDVVAQVRPVADDVAQRPDGLFAHVGVRRVQQRQEQRHRVGLHHRLRLRRRPRRDVR